MSQKIITKIFNYASGEGADNLVIAKRADQLILDYYFSGQEKRSLVLPKKLEQELFSSLRRILAIAPEEFTTQKYCKLPHRTGYLNFYLTILPEASGEKMIINFIKRPPTLWRLNQLGLQRSELREIKKSLALKSGLILISSQGGGGKSATLNSLLFELGDSNKSVYFLLKHRAYEIPGIVSLAPTATNWEKILALDSEIIFADDLDETNALTQAIRAAASGRLVFGAITADNSWAGLEKIIELPLPLKLKLDSLKMIINQRLIGLKRKSEKTSSDRRREIGLFEILKITPALKKFLVEARGQKFQDYRQKLEKLALKNGFRPLADDRFRKTKDGLI